VSPESSSRQQRELIAALRRQDPSATQRVLQAYGPMLRGFLTESLDDRGAMEDVLQQTLIEVWRRGPDYDPQRASVATWLLMIARSRAIDHLRRRVPEPFDPAAVGELVDRDTEHATDALVQRWRMAGLLAALPREESRLLAMRFYQGLSQREICQRTGIPLGTVKMRMARALERLRTMLHDEEPPL
jgi:RNA polymerase sigma-70 factor, ECF subfamily